MRRASLVVAELEKKIEYAKERKKQLLDYVFELNHKLKHSLISYEEYHKILRKPYEGKTISERVKEYDFYIKRCREIIAKEKRKIWGKRIPVYLFGILLIFASFYMVQLEQGPTGFAIQGDEVVTNANVIVTTIQGEAILGQPVNWTKKIILDEPSSIKIKIPGEASNIEVKSNSEDEKKEVPKDEASPSQEPPASSENETNIFVVNETAINETGFLGPEENNTLENEIIANETLDIVNNSINSINFSITGGVISGTGSSSGFLGNIFGAITGNVVREEVQEIETAENATDYEVTYETPAPYAIEEEIPNGKSVKIVGPESVHYENVLSFTNLPEGLNIKNPSVIKIYWIENDTYILPTSVEDKNNNGIYDYIEWITPHLSNQTFNIIVITKAEHLNSNREFISDIYEEVKELDDVWSETIPDGDYVRVTFEVPLTSDRDITIYPRTISGEPKVEVYEKDEDNLIAEFTSINSNQYNKIYLTNLVGEQDTFDLRVVGGSIEFDHVIDPVETLTPIVHANTELNLVDLDSSQVTAITSDDSSSVTIGKGLLLTTEMSDLTETIDTLNDANCSLIYYTASGYPASSIVFSVRDSFGGNVLDTVTLPASGTDSLVHLTDLETKGLSASEVSTMVVYVQNTISAKPYDLYVDKISCTIDYTGPTADTESPKYSSLTETPSDPATYSFGQNYVLGSTWTDNQDGVSTVIINFDGINSTVARSSGTALNGVYNFSISDLASGTYNYYWWANDTAGNSNQTGVQSYTVNKATLSATMTNDTVLTRTYDGTSTAIGYSESNNGDGDVTYNIYVNGINEGTSYVQGAAGNYNIILNSTGGTNYSSSASLDSETLTINQATPIGTLAGTSPITEGTPADIEGTESNTGDGDVTYLIYRDGVQVSNPDTSVLDVGTYNYVYNTTGGTNYSASASLDTFELIVNSANSPPMWQDNSTNGTSAGTNILHSVNWTDDTALSGYIFSFDNGTGTFANDSFVSMTGAQNWSNVTKYVNETVSSTIQWRVYANDSLNVWNSTDIFSYTTTNSPPTIPFVQVITAKNPTEDSTTTITFNFTVTDSDGSANIDTSSGKAYFQKGGETTRSDVSCISQTPVGNSINFSCTIDMWYFDGSGAWTINITASDINGADTENSSTTFTYNLLTAMKMSPTSLSWPAVGLQSADVGSNNDPVVINNTGNDESLSVNVTAYDLQGEQTTSEYIYANNFTIGISSEGCLGTVMSNATAIAISSAVLNKGNHSLNDGSTGQEQIYFCIKGVPPTISSQSYSSSVFGPWGIGIFLALLVSGGRRKKKRNKTKLEEDKLFDAFELIAEELREEYSLNKKELLEIIIKKLKKKYKFSSKELLELISKESFEIPVSIFRKEIGSLESIVKYMKENLNMKYVEIAKALGRDERTIWTSYKKSKEKFPEAFAIKEDEETIPASIFKENDLTILESIVIHLKKKGLKYSEIAGIIGRDQRNVWTIYLRASKKLNKI